MEVSNAARAQVQASVKRTQVDGAVATADTYTVVAAQETVRAAQAGVDPAEIVAGTITAQVIAQSRRKADTIDSGGASGGGISGDFVAVCIVPLQQHAAFMPPGKNPKDS